MKQTNRPENIHCGVIRTGPERHSAARAAVDVDYEHVDGRGHVIERFPTDKHRVHGDERRSIHGMRLALFNPEARVSVPRRTAGSIAFVLIVAILVSAGAQVFHNTGLVPAVNAQGPDHRGGRAGEVSVRKDSGIESRQASDPEHLQSRQPRQVRDYADMIVSLSGGGTGY